MNYEILSKLTQEATPQTLCYIELRRKYRNYSAQQSEIFLAEYRQTIGSLDELISKCDSLVDKYLSAGIDFALSDVVGLEIYDVSKDEFRSKYFTRYDTWKRDFKPIRDRHDAITLSVDELSKKREEEKNRSSGGVIGGGFGLEGAAKGIAIATAANLAISALGGIVNAATASMEAGKTKKEKEAIFRNSDLAQNIAASIKGLIFSIHFAIVDLANGRENHLSTYHVPSSEEIKKSRAIFENISSGRVHGEMVMELMLQVFALNPYDEKIYEYCLRQYGDANNDLFGISTFFAVDEVSRFKKILIDEHFKSLTLTSIESCNKSISQIESYCLSLGIVDFSSWTEKIQSQIESIKVSTNAAEIEAAKKAHIAETAAEIQSRTFKGTTYATIEEKDLEVERSNKCVDGVYYENAEEANRVRQAQAEREKTKIDVGWQRSLLIFVFPFPSAFLLMLGDYRKRARQIAFAWMALYLFSIIIDPNKDDKLMITILSLILGTLISAFFLHKVKKKT